MPGLNWLIATIYKAADFGYSFAQAEQAGYKAELDAAISALKEMHHNRMITVLPGGDYGFAWTPHGTYARDLEHFVTLLGFSPMEAIVAATAGVASTMFMRGTELGKIQEGFLADCLLVDGDPLADISMLQNHDRLHVIIINGRVHKASHCDFVSTNRGTGVDKMAAPTTNLTNFITYRLDDGYGGIPVPRLGHLDPTRGTITPISFASGTPIENLYQLIEVGEDNIIPGGDPFPFDLTKVAKTPTHQQEDGNGNKIQILPPLADRDVLAIGKNYSEHAKEFNASGYDSSDKVDMPTHPVVFTKRATSIVGYGEDILLHEGFTETLDYEGEIGVIIGKSGFGVSEEEAWGYVWGYTIINDVTAREKQRDHKQFFIGKSGDGYCPMGPVAVPKSALAPQQPLTVTTHVNGEFRQRGTTDDLIFSIPTLIKTISQAQTIRPGDVIATGTPAGVGFGLNPPVFLKPGDVVEIEVTGLGALRNTVAKAEPGNYLTKRVQEHTTIPIHNLSGPPYSGCTTLPNGKRLHVHKIGSGPETLVSIHGLGGSSSFFSPLLPDGSDLRVKLEAKYTSLLIDLEGHGLSPTKATSKLSIASYAEDVQQLLLGLPTTEKGITIVAHSMGCFVALLLATYSSLKIKQLVLLGPPPIPFPSAAADANLQRAALVRTKGWRDVALQIAVAATSNKTRTQNPLALTAVQMSLLSHDPEGYAKGCTALAGAKDLNIDLGEVGKRVESTLIITGAEDKVATPANVDMLAKTLSNAEVVILPDVGHWHVFEDVDGVSEALASFLA